VVIGEFACKDEVIYLVSVPLPCIHFMHKPEAHSVCVSSSFHWGLYERLFNKVSTSLGFLTKVSIYFDAVCF